MPVEANRNGWRWNVKITKGNFNLTIDFSQINNEAGTISIEARTKRTDVSKDSPNVFRLRPIGRLNYQEDLEEEDGPSFFGPLELDVRREVRRE